jgi:hypothetical protein
MPRRVSMPTADDLFRPTVVPDPDPDPEATADSAEPAGQAAAATSAPKPAPKPARHTPSGRVRHDEKMTVYVTSDELLDIEHARLTLRRDHSLAVDRGRLVREAVAMVLADLEQQGADSALVRRLTAE